MALRAGSVSQTPVLGRLLRYSIPHHPQLQSAGQHRGFCRPFSITNRRRHAIEVQAKKDKIRAYIQDLQHARRKFSTSQSASHGHIDPPKPGEEYGYGPPRLEAGLRITPTGCMFHSLTKMERDTILRSRRETICLI